MSQVWRCVSHLLWVDAPPTDHKWDIVRLHPLAHAATPAGAYEEGTVCQRARVAHHAHAMSGGCRKRRMNRDRSVFRPGAGRPVRH